MGVILSAAKNLELAACLLQYAGRTQCVRPCARSFVVFATQDDRGGS
ncbi:MAG: hypothetical protein AVDCRST_MAG42-1771 [uncultured Chthoniobacterales bacterium]|uniref:Uncharacterized protein n=1 Tax=uncultured Chthoniobacterales bacterium TaxID=1836801 RepID=A0A6J4HVL6_9BACT|nr:MAG: hypothetical protein AVDCRST_MAG42-1771 [uncultured Chthoniobacterales bacterium]